MRIIIPILTLVVGGLMMLSAQERYIIWHEGELDILLENDNAGLTRAEGVPISNSYLLAAQDPSKIKLSNNSSETVKVKVLALGSRKESLWQNLEPETITRLQDIIQNQEPDRMLGEGATLWDQVTAFYASTLEENKQQLASSIEEQMERRAASEKASIKKVDGVTFNTPGWVELNGPEELDISWTSRHPISSVCLQIIGQPEPIFKVENLGYYRIHYPGLNRSIRENILRNRRYEIQVTVRDEAGAEKIATTRFFIKKSLDFDPSVGKEFALEKLNFKWESQYTVTEVMFQNAESKDTLYYVNQPDVIQNIHRISVGDGPKNSYQLNIADFDVGAIGQIKRGSDYDLVVAISDERGAKRLFSKRYYCLSTEETIVKGLDEDRDAYRKLMEFVETVEAPLLTEAPKENGEKTAPSSQETIVISDEEPEKEEVKEEKVAEEQKVIKEEKVSLPKEDDELVEKQPVRQTEEKPVFFYSFDQPLITDQSGNNFNALGSVLTTDRKGRANQAYGFDGRQDFIALPTNDQFVFTEQTPFTLSFWYKADQPEASLSQIYQEGGSEGSFFLDVKLSNGQIMVWCCAKDISCETLFGKKPKLEEWHHLAITFDDASQLNLFMDGELVRSRSITLDIAGDQACAILFGKDQDGQTFLSGGMDDIVLFKRALSAEEVKALAKN